MSYTSIITLQHWHNSWSLPFPQTPDPISRQVFLILPSPKMADLSLIGCWGPSPQNIVSIWTDAKGKPTDLSFRFSNHQGPPPSQSSYSHTLLKLHSLKLFKGFPLHLEQNPNSFQGPVTSCMTRHMPMATKPSPIAPRTRAAPLPYWHSGVVCHLTHKHVRYPLTRMFFL